MTTLRGRRANVFPSIALSLILLCCGGDKKPAAADDPQVHTCLGDLSGFDALTATAELGAVEAEVIAMGRTDAGFDALLGDETDAILESGHTFESSAVEAVAADQGFDLPSDDPPALEFSCPTADDSVKQAAKVATKQVWAGSAFIALGELAMVLRVDVPASKLDFAILEGDKQFGKLSAHFRQTTSLTIDKQGSAVTISATLGLKTTVLDDSGSQIASTTETATTIVTLDYCPDASGHVLGSIEIRADGLASDAGFYDAQFHDDFDLSVNDDADITQVKTEGAGQYKSSGTRNLEISTHNQASPDLGNYAVDAGHYQIEPGSGDNLDASVAAAKRFIGASDYAGLLAALVARDGSSKKFRNSACVSLNVTPDSETVDRNARVDVTATVHHEIEKRDLPLPVVVQLRDKGSVSPENKPEQSPASFTYVAGSNANDSGTLEFRSTSNRGIAKSSVTYTVKKPCGAGENDCPKGTTWDAASSTCLVECGAGETIAGFACVYAGTANMSSLADDGTVGPSESAEVTFTATSFDGCSIEYTPSGTATYSPPPKDGCSYSPMSATMTSSNTKGKFIIGVSPPTLVADLLTLIPGTMTCGKTSVQTSYGTIWILAVGETIEPGTPLIGMDTVSTGPGSNFSEWSLAPQ